jgi:hypothetical protein
MTKFYFYVEDRKGHQFECEKDLEDDVNPEDLLRALDKFAEQSGVSKFDCVEKYFSTNKPTG